MWLDLSVLFILTVSYIVIINLMNKLHRHEFNKHKKPMFLLWLSLSSILVVWMAENAVYLYVKGEKIRQYDFST